MMNKDHCFSMFLKFDFIVLKFACCITIEVFCRQKILALICPVQVWGWLIRGSAYT